MMKITRHNVKRQYHKVEAVGYEQGDEVEWYVIAPTIEEAVGIADSIGMPDDRVESLVWLTDEQYSAIPEVD